MHLETFSASKTAESRIEQKVRFQLTSGKFSDDGNMLIKYK